MSLVVLQWGGRIVDDHGSTYNTVEEWSCSMSLLSTVSPDPSTILATAGPLIASYHNDASSYVDSTALLDFIKCNEVDVATGIQITDPTVELIYTTPVRGGHGAGVYPILTSAYRVSIDNSTRDRTKRGGWFMPRGSFTTQGNGRIVPTQVAEMLTTATTLIDGLNAISNVSVGVWSRKNASVTAITRLRIGDVPDNISTRKNALAETYQATTITP